MVEDTNGDPEPGLNVYAFDDTTYTGYNGTANASGQVTMTPPQGDYRFRADKDGEQPGVDAVWGGGRCGADGLGVHR